MTNKVETRNEKDVSSALTKMKSGIMAVLFHCTIFEDEEFRHQYCPKGSDSWCPYRRRVVNWDSQKSHHISPQLFPYLLEVFEARSTESYLRRVVTGYNQNSLESLNQLIWTNVSKSKFHGAKRVYIAVGLAVLRFEKGMIGTMLLKKKLGITVTEYHLGKGMIGTMLLQKKLGIPVTEYHLGKSKFRDNERIFHAELRLKKARKLFDEAKDEAKAKEAVDNGYEAGGCDVPAPAGPMVEVVPDTGGEGMYAGGYVAMSYPGGVDVAFVHQETPSQVEVSYLKMTGSGSYSLYDPPYEEMRDKSQVLMRLSWPSPKGLTLRELSLLVFLPKELAEAKNKWIENRVKK